MIKKANNTLILIIALALFIVILSSSNVYATTSKSTSISKTQYFNPDVTNPFGSDYGTLLSFPPQNNNQEGDFFDMQIFIPPLGCKPYVVRSDLLEEQNVPIFCELDALKINPGVDISKISRVVARGTEANSYISGVGFYPSRAAIRSRGSLVSTPSDNKIGYVVVVLKKQETENQMPDFINTTLSAYVEYGADNAFGIGQSVFYLPVMTDEEFDNNYREYGFMNGIGYLRAENVQTNGTTLSVYSGEFNKIYSGRLAEGQSSSDIYMPTFTGGQGIRLVLRELSNPETKAKIIVNGNELELHEGERFYDNKCTVGRIIAYGGDTGYVKITCGGEEFTLVKNFESIKMTVGTKTEEVKIGTKLSPIEDIGSVIYPIYMDNIELGEEKKSYIVLALSKNEIPSEQLSTMTAQINTEINSLQKSSDFASFKQKVEQLNIDGADSLKLIYEATNENIYYGSGENKQSLILKFDNKGLESGGFKNNLAESYYNKALNEYEKLASDFPEEQNLLINTGQTYGADSLWSEYNLAFKIGMKSKAYEILSRITSIFPNSYNGVYNSKQNLKEAYDSLLKNRLLSSEGSTKYLEKQDISFELVYIREPSINEASANLRYVSSLDKISESRILKKGQIFEVGPKNVRIEVVSLNQNGVSIRYSCETTSNGQIKRTPSISKTLREKDQVTLDNCGGYIVADDIKFTQIAKVEVVPTMSGRSRESNFTFSISIEKRPDLFKLTPAEANKKIEKLNKQIEEWKNITESLGKVISAGKLACLATSAGLNFKNVLSGYNGETTARLEVMTREGGWNDKCKQLVASSGYTDVDACLRDKEISAKAEKDIGSVSKIMAELNKLEEGYKKANTDKTGINYDEVFNKRLAGMKSSYSDFSESLIDENGASVKTIEGKNIGNIISKLNKDYIEDRDSTELALNLAIIERAKNNPNDFSSEFVESSKKKAYRLLSAVQNRIDAYDGKSELSLKYGVPSEAIYHKVGTNPERVGYSVAKWSEVNKANVFKFDGINTFTQDTKVAFVPGVGINYIVTLDGKENQLFVNNIYKVVESISGGSVNGIIKPLTSEEEKIARDSTNMVFEIYDGSSYKNTCKGCNYMEVFSLEPNKGMPALLPFDQSDGWYILVENLIPAFGAKASYQDSGRINTFRLCNVGKNGFIERGRNDDICRRFDLYTGDTLDSFPYLKPDQSKAIVSRAISAIESAQSQLTSGHTSIKIDNVALKVVPIEGNTGTKCTDFMSATDCNIMFNVCDPFVCPSSRCDLGGTYRVDNVIQSGIIGSIALCLPNMREGIVMPVCLTGINAGIEGWTSILESYRDCLNASATTNKTIGLCDEVYSVYACDFFWRQVGPFASTIAKNIFTGGYLFEKGTRGGGEYLFARDAWNNAEKSWQFFTTNYASNSKLSFGAVSFSEIGSEMCKGRLSVTYPDGLDSVLEPESPVQINAWFDEMTYTDATVPPTSQYKVFYHIYAGKDEGANYQVYLKSAPTALGYIGKSSSIVDTGYVAKGEKITETKDFIDVSGFKELCVRINKKDYCGFKSVSTSFALNYAKDELLKEQATDEITTEEECISGTASLSAFLTPNAQQAAEGVISPEIYNQGIIRVCSTKNPAAGVDESRWAPVGYCGESSMKCWVDENSVRNAIKGRGIENSTISELNNMDIQSKLAEGNYYTPDEGKAEIGKLKEIYMNDLLEKIKETKFSSTLSEDQLKNQLKAITSSNTIQLKDEKSARKVSVEDIENDINQVSDKIGISYQKASLMLLKARFYDGLARALSGIEDLSGANVVATSVGGGVGAVKVLSGENSGGVGPLSCTIEASSTTVKCIGEGSEELKDLKITSDRRRLSLDGKFVADVAEEGGIKVIKVEEDAPEEVEVLEGCEVMVYPAPEEIVCESGAEGPYTIRTDNYIYTPEGVKTKFYFKDNKREVIFFENEGGEPFIVFQPSQGWVIETPLSEEESVRIDIDSKKVYEDLSGSEIEGNIIAPTG